MAYKLTIEFLRQLFYSPSQRQKLLYSPIVHSSRAIQLLRNSVYCSTQLVFYLIRRSKIPLFFIAKSHHSFDVDSVQEHHLHVLDQLSVLKIQLRYLLRLKVIRVLIEILVAQWQMLLT